ncbi:polymorphic outer membrane protein [Fimbriiglobus ruber]|uniref:Polymorphic outer membrane protein n=1 Tax=Fimbriiglobus ruber TaxID=1908690 RepID=A0A225DZU0_9BACT|nr:polymorphic outer membrane protein [Fimbriiglobus ruber]
MQALLNAAPSFGGTGTAIASATGMTADLPVVDASIDNVLGVSADFSRIATAIGKINSATVTDNDSLIAALQSADPNDTFSLGPNGENLSVSVVLALPTETLTIAPTAAGLGGGTPQYFTQASLSGSGAVQYTNNGPLVGAEFSFGTDDTGVYFNAGPLLALEASASFPVSGAVKVGSTVFSGQFAGTAAVNLSGVVTLNSSGESDHVYLSDIPASATFNDPSELPTATLTGNDTVKVLGVNLLTWGTATNGGAPLLSWGAGVLSGTPQVDTGTPQFIASNEGAAESTLFSFVTDNMLGLTNLHANLGPFNIQGLSQAADMIRLISFIADDYSSALSGDGTTSSADGVPTDFQDDGFQVAALPSDPSAFQFQQDPSQLIAFAEGQNVDLFSYSGGGAGDGFDVTVPVVEETYAIFGGILTITVTGSIGVDFTPEYHLGMGVDANGLYVSTDPTQTYVKLQASGGGSLVVNAQLFDVVGLGDSTIGLNLAYGTGFYMDPAANNRLYLASIMPAADQSNVTVTSGLPSTLGGVSNWLADHVELRSDPSVSSELYFSQGVNNPGPDTLQDIFGAIPDGIRKKLQWIANELGIGQQYQNLSNGLTSEANHVQSVVTNVVTNPVGAAHGVLSSLGLADSTDATAFGGTFSGNVIPIVDAAAQAEGISPPAPVSVPVDDLSDVPGTYADNNPDHPDVPPDGIFHYTFADLSALFPGILADDDIGRAEYTWSWALTPKGTTSTNLSGGTLPQTSSPSTDAIPYKYDPSTGILTVDATNPNADITLEPSTDGGVVLGRMIPDGSGGEQVDSSVVFPSLNGVVVTTAGGDNTFYEAPGVNVPVTYTGSTGTDSVTVQDGNNAVTTGSGGGLVQAGNGNNTIATAGGASVVLAGNGNNTVTAGNTYVSLGSGANTIHSLGGLQAQIGSGNYTIDGLQVGDQLITQTSPPTPAGQIVSLTAADGTPVANPDLAPTVTALSVSTGPAAGGTTVTITGTNLGNAIVVDFGTVAGTVVSDTATQIVATSPAGAAGAVDVTVTTVNGTSATSPADQFTYAAVPPVSPPPSTVPPGTPKPSLVGYAQVAVGADAGGTGTVTVYNPDGSVAYMAAPFGASFTAGVRVAVADLNGDGAPELIAGTGPGVANQVVVLDGKTHQQIASFEPFEGTFTGGLFITVGDINGDGVPDLVVTPDQSGGPIVAAYDGAALGKGQVVQLARFFGINDPNFRGGARAAVGDINGDGFGDVIVSAGFGGGPRVAIFSGAAVATNTPTELMSDFFAFEPSLRNGAYVTAGDLTGKGYADLVFGAGPGGGPRVRAVDPAVLLAAAGDFSSLDDSAVSGAGLADFFAGDPTNRGGVRVAVANLDGDTKADVVVGSGTGAGAAVTAYTGAAIAANPASPAAAGDLDAFPGFTGGVFVG